ncbi:hypothetical protein GBAR_LOCUS23357, partial [Geodia barretti]
RLLRCACAPRTVRTEEWTTAFASAVQRYRICPLKLSGRVVLENRLTKMERPGFRSLKNTDIGIDISVPGHEPASSPKVVKRYHVLVLPLCHTLRRLHKVKVQLCSLRCFEIMKHLKICKRMCFSPFQTSSYQVCHENITCLQVILI